MTAVDTNVLVRLLTNDDPNQCEAVRRLFARGAIWISKTVLLETNWVLRSTYQFEQDAIRLAFIKLFGLDNVRVEDGAAVATALALTVKGVDWADALHMVSRPEDTTFVSFDRPLIQRATRAGVSDIALPE